MKKLENGIVFSNDIARILKGNNALNYSYEKNGLILPEKEYMERLRRDFKKDTNRIFQGQSTILEEEEMLESMNEAMKDVYGRVPHLILRPYLLNTR